MNTHKKNDKRTLIIYLDSELKMLLVFVSQIQIVFYLKECF